MIFPEVSWRTKLWRATPMALAYIAILILLVYAVFPFFWMSSTSLRNRAEIRTTVPSLLPASLNWSNDQKVIFRRVSLHGALMAEAVLGMLPVTIASLYLRRFLIAGISAGATKG